MTPIYVKVEWPPPDEGVHLAACTGMLVHGVRPTQVAEYFLDSVAWQRTNIDSQEILALLAAIGQRGTRRASANAVHLRLLPGARRAVQLEGLAGCRQGRV